MSYIKLEDNQQKLADKSYDLEKEILDLVKDIYAVSGAVERWRQVAYNQIGLGFMAFRKAIAESQQDIEGLHKRG